MIEATASAVPTLSGAISRLQRAASAGRATPLSGKTTPSFSRRPGKVPVDVAAAEAGRDGCYDSLMRWGLVLCAALVACADNTPGVAPSVPPPVPEAAPSARETGWEIQGAARDAYAVRRDLAQRGALLLEPVGETHGHYGTWMRPIDAAPYRGRRVRISASTRTEGTTRRVDLWARAQAVDSPGDGMGLGGDWKKLPTDSDWSPRTIVFDVAEEAAWIDYGFGIAGPGRLWFEGAKIEVVGADVATTNDHEGERPVGHDARANPSTIRFRGTAVQSPSAAPLGGVTACVFAQPTTPCVTTDVTGAFDLPVPARSETGVTLALPGRDPVLVSFVTGARDQDGFRIGMQSASLVSGVATALGLAYPIDASSGFLAAFASAPGSQANLPGVRVAITPATGKGPIYLASTGAPDPSATSTSARGVGFFGSVTPGALTVTFSPAAPGATLSCTSNFGGWPSALPNSVRVPIVAGFDTHVGMACR
jgi:hypothetical protein